MTPSSPRRWRILLIAGLILAILTALGLVTLGNVLFHLDLP